MAKLATFVHVTDEKGTNHVFGPADEVPAWAESLITNPKAWSEPPSRSANRLTVPESRPPVKRATPRRKAAAGDDAVHGG
ncbi:hypothetical protein ACFQ8W_00495 [Streptomyces sp. NPDC056508]|uniref:hypothetical protein n=1 Tax=Streptomyces sp. NPDC056508 TaxID=3345845 RepID=UPI00369B933C